VRKGKGLSVALATLERTRSGAGAQAIGIAQGAIDYARAYAKERIAFGKPIIELPTLQAKLADMQTKTAAGRELLYKACAKADRNEATSACTPRWPSSSAATRPWRSPSRPCRSRRLRLRQRVPRRAHDRDAKITQIYEGTNEIQPS